MHRLLNSLSLTAAFGGLAVTLTAFVAFCVAGLRQGFAEFIFSGLGMALVIAFFAGVILAVGGVVGLTLLSFRR